MAILQKSQPKSNLMQTFSNSTILKSHRKVHNHCYLLSLGISERSLKMKTFSHVFLLLITCCVSIIPAVHSHCNANQKLSLLRLKRSLVFDSSLSSKLITWISSTDCCYWAGVTCSTDGRVIGLDIGSESISCSIDDSSSLFDLQHLEILNLSSDYNFNDFNGSQIPSSIGKLQKLRYLNLSRGTFSGQVPIEISQLTKLVILDISNNGYFGDPLKLENPNLSMLVQNLTELEELYLDDVDMSAHGTNWCQAISYSLPKLRELSLCRCGVSGPIDHSLAKLQSLSVIQLDRNNISGPVPRFFASFSNLTSLSLYDCGLQGTFPKEIFQVPSLQSIDLMDNPELHGSLPEFAKNGSLRFLLLRGSNFSGSLPNSIGNLKMLYTIFISGCNFSGSLPVSLGNLKQLANLDISSNRFSGPIDFIHWENLINVENVMLQSNLLIGNVPLSIFSPPILKVLYLSNNQFSGQLPEFANVSSNLWYALDLSSNHLEGPVPVSIFNLRGLSQLYLSSNSFSSFPFNGPQQLRTLTWIDLSYNSLLVLYNGTNSSSSSFPQIGLLNLASNKLRAFPDFLINHSSLYSLDLSKNQIQGEIPNWIWSLESLKFLNLSSNSFVTLEAPSRDFTCVVDVLDLHSNQFQGRIPIFPPSATYLDYSRNNFSSSIPTDIGDVLNLRFLSLSSNNLQGLIPVSICNATMLVLLDLSNNSLSGTIPECLSKLPLGVLDLRRNKFTGIISNFEFPDYCVLRTLSLGGNRIEGLFPTSLVNCTLLNVVNLANNRMTDTFPCLLKSMSSLRVLVLRSNKFYGSIECMETNGTWPVLHIIDLAHNNFSGEIPGTSLTTWHAMKVEVDDYPFDDLGFMYDLGSRTRIGIFTEDEITATSKGLEMDLVKIIHVFTLIDFSGNKFNGSIPKELGEFKSLYVLNLSGNAFAGGIPSSFGNMHQLESLDLSKNNLSGQIPPQLTKLTFLAVLDLSYNQLVGKIPTSTQFSTFPKASFEGNKDLWGPPLTVDNTVGLSTDSPPTLNGSHPNSGDDIDWDLISVEIGFALGFGISIMSLLFCKRWRQWYYGSLYNIVFKIFPRLKERFGACRNRF